MLFTFCQYPKVDILKSLNVCANCRPLKIARYFAQVNFTSQEIHHSRVLFPPVGQHFL